MLAGDVVNDSIQPSKRESSAESNVEDDARSRSRHRRILRHDDRSSSETSGGSATVDTARLDHGRHSAVRRGSSVDDAIRSAGHNRHVSFILSSGEVGAGNCTTSSAGHHSTDGPSIPINNRLFLCLFVDPEGGSQKATLVVLLVLVISSLKIFKAFLIRSGAQRNFAYTFVQTSGVDLC